MLYSITELRKYSSIIAVGVIILTLITYASLKCSAASEDFNTHTQQYQFLLTGIYIKQVAPAICLFLIHTLVLFAMLFAHYRVFSANWSNSVIYFSRKPNRTSMNNLESTASDAEDGQRASYRQSTRLSYRESIITFGSFKHADMANISQCCYQICCLLIFLAIMVSVNIYYVILANKMSDTNLLLIQLALLVFNGCMRFLIPYLG